MRSRLGRRLRVAMLTFTVTLLLGHFLRAQSAPPSYVALKAEMKVFEAVIDQTMAQTFAPPFGLLEKTKGTYLPDFGLVFSLEVNLYPLRVPSPFDPRPLSKQELGKERKTKLERIRVIKESVPRLLADHASSLHQVGPEESVAVVVHLFYFQTELEGLPTQLVIQIKKLDLDQYWEKRLSYEQLVGKMKVLEF